MAIRIRDLDTDLDMDPDPYRDTDKTCLGGGMHCPSASSCIFFFKVSFCTPEKKNNSSLLFTDVQTVSMEEIDTDTSYVRPQISQDEAISMPSSSSPDLRSWKKFADSEELLITSAPADETLRPVEHIPLQVVDPISIDHLPDGTEVLRKRSEQTDEVKDNGRRIKTIILRTYHKTVCTETVTSYEIILPRKTERLVGTTVEEHITDMAPGVDETMTEGVRRIHSRHDFDKETLPDGTWLKRSVSLTIIDPLESEVNEPQIDSISLPGDIEKRVDESDIKPDGIKARKVLRTVVSRVDKTTAVEETSIIKVPSREPPDEAPVQPSLVDENGPVSSTASSENGFEMVNQDFVAEQQTVIEDIVDQTPVSADGVPLSVDAVMATSKPVHELEILLRDATEDGEKTTGLREPDKASTKEHPSGVTDMVAFPSPISDDQSFVFVSKEADSILLSKKEGPVDAAVEPTGSVPDRQVNLGKEEERDTDSKVRLPDVQKTEDLFAPTEQSVMEDITSFDRLLQADDKPDVHSKEPEILSPASVQYRDGTTTLEDMIGVTQERVEPVGKLERADKDEIIENVQAFDQFVLSDEQVVEASYKQVPVQENGDEVTPIETSDTAQYYDGTRKLEDVIGLLQKPKATLPATTECTVPQTGGLIPDEAVTVREDKTVDHIPEDVRKSENIDVPQYLPEIEYADTEMVVSTEAARDKNIIRLAGEPDVTQQRETAVSVEYFDGTRKLEDVIGVVQQPDVTDIEAADITPHIDGVLHDDKLHIPELIELPEEAMNLDMAKTLDGLCFEESPVDVKPPTADLAADEELVKDVSAFEKMLFPTDQAVEIPTSELAPQFQGVAPDSDLQKQEPENVPQVMATFDITAPLVCKDVDMPEVTTGEPDVVQHTERAISVEFFDGTRKLEDIVGVVQQPDVTQIEAADATPQIDGVVHDDELHIPQLKELPEDAMNLDMAKTLDGLRFEESPEVVKPPTADLATDEEVVKDVAAFEKMLFPTDLAVEIPTTELTPRFEGVVHDSDLQKQKPEKVPRDMTTLDSTAPLVGKDVDIPEVTAREPDVVQQRETAVSVEYFDGTRKLEDVLSLIHI